MSKQPHEFTWDDMLSFAKYVNSSVSQGNLSQQTAISMLYDWKKSQGLTIIYKGDVLHPLEDITTDGNGIAHIAVQIPGRML